MAGTIDAFIRGAQIGRGLFDPVTQALAERGRIGEQQRRALGEATQYRQAIEARREDIERQAEHVRLQTLNNYITARDATLTTLYNRALEAGKEDKEKGWRPLTEKEQGEAWDRIETVVNKVMPSPWKEMKEGRQVYFDLNPAFTRRAAAMGLDEPWLRGRLQMLGQPPVPPAPPTGEPPPPSPPPTRQQTAAEIKAAERLAAERTAAAARKAARAAPQTWRDIPIVQDIGWLGGKARGAAETVGKAAVGAYRGAEKYLGIPLAREYLGLPPGGRVGRSVMGLYGASPEGAPMEAPPPITEAEARELLTRQLQEVLPPPRYTPIKGRRM